MNFTGVSNISYLIFYYQPDTSLKLYIKSDVIQKYDTNLLSIEKKDFDKSFDNSYNLEINLNLRRCQPGEYYISSIKK